jgi:lysylphosphatidylglycerol synthetase-like protein (DUF2156 family)
MNIKTLTNPKALFAFVAAILLVVFLLLSPSVSAQAQKVKDICQNKEDKAACQQKLTSACASAANATARDKCYSDEAAKFPTKAFLQTQNSPSNQCGSGDQAVKTRFNFGCVGGNPEWNGKNLNAIEDVAYAIIRFLSVGVGLVVVASIVWAGIQYSSSEGSAEATQAAKDRVRSSIIALIIYLFIFAIVQYLVPGGVFAGTIIPPGLVHV